MKNKTDEHGRRSIFLSLFVPLFLIMLLQALIFYFAAVYGGIEESLTQNEADILSQRLISRKNEIETRFNGKWTALDGCRLSLQSLYGSYEESHGDKPLARDAQLQIAFLEESAGLLIDTLRHNEVNGIFLILNDQTKKTGFAQDGSEQKYGLCIRDMDQESNYSGREDLLLERAPASIVDALGCPLDSWWEARYTFFSKEDGDYYYYPLDAAWDNPAAKGDDLAYCSGVHQISGSDPPFLSYSLPLISETGYPYGVIGVELSVKHIASLMPHKELNRQDKCCYVLAQQDADSTECIPLIGTGTLYSRCFGDNSAISLADVTPSGGYAVTGRGNVALYCDAKRLDIYNNNNPFEDRSLTLMALVESSTLFAYIDHIKLTLMIVSLFSLLLGVAGIVWVSRHFASPITALASRVRGMTAQSDFELDRLGIIEIDQLVDSIEELNRNVSRNRARTEFFSRMSHDMRTPMNAIIGFSSPDLLKDATEAVKDDYLNKIHASGKYLLALINEVLDMTKIESNKTRLHLEPAQACDLFKTTIPIIEKLAQKKKIDFVADIRIDPAVYIKADVQHLNQIVMNLLSNGVKFTPEGGSVKLDAEITEDAPDSPEVLCQIVVTDSGIGMSESFMKDLYTPFEQESSRHEGTGLGLSIAQKLVKLMGGSINCVSRQNMGTTFTVTIPLARSSAEAAESAACMQPFEKRSLDALRGKRILVCEDNAINTLVICRLLGTVGIVPQTAEDGRMGLDAFAAAAPGTIDAILMDVRMPVMDGLSATKAIRALDKADAGTVPIIAMTADAFDDDVRACRDAGMNEHLAKPVEPQLLFRTLLRFLA